MKNNLDLLRSSTSLRVAGESNSRPSQRGRARGFRSRRREGPEGKWEVGSGKWEVDDRDRGEGTDPDTNPRGE